MCTPEREAVRLFYEIPDTTAKAVRAAVDGETFASCLHKLVLEHESALAEVKRLKSRLAGHADWCGRKGKGANVSGKWCSTCGQIVSHSGDIRHWPERIAIMRDARIDVAGGEWMPYHGGAVHPEAAEYVPASTLEGAVGDRDRLQRAIDRAHEAAHEMNHDAKSALTCVLEWLEPVVSGTTSEGGSDA